jgi:mRNA interferase MazF
MVMKKAGQVVVIKFPQTDYQGSKLRPALLIAPLPGKYGDWLVCMISSQINQAINNFDEFVYEDSIDFVRSGIKKASVIRRLTIFRIMSLIVNLKIQNSSQNFLIKKI